MRNVTLACLALLGACGAAPAQQVSWSDEQWGFGLSLAEQGWEVVEPSRSIETTVVLAARPTGTEEGPLCELDYLSQQVPILSSRDRMNAATRELLDGDVIANMRSAFTVQRAEVVEVSGVAVLDMDTLFMSLQATERRFFLQRGHEVRMYTLSCSAEREDSHGIEGMRRVAASLRFWEPPP